LHEMNKYYNNDKAKEIKSKVSNKILREKMI